MKKLISALCLSLFCLGCQNKDQDKLIKEQQIEIDALKAKSDSLVNKNYNDQVNNQIDLLKASKRKYAFVVITIKVQLMDFDTRDEIHIPKYKTVQQISGIEEFENWNKEVEYRLLDDVQNKIVRESSPQNLNITKRVCYAFDSYEKASLAREKIVTE